MQATFRKGVILGVVLLLVVVSLLVRDLELQNVTDASPGDARRKYRVSTSVADACVMSNSDTR